MDQQREELHAEGVDPSRATRIQSGGVKEFVGVVSVELFGLALARRRCSFQRARLTESPFIEGLVVEDCTANEGPFGKRLTP